MLSFNDYISFLATNALLGLGQIENPATGIKEMNLNLVYYTLSVLEMLQVKTHGNLTHEESDILDKTVSTISSALMHIDKETHI